MNYEEKVKQIELFNAWADFEGFDIKMSNETEHSNKETHCAFLGWMASLKNLEGCVVVPVEPTYAMYQAYEKHSVAPMSTLSRTGYKAMVEAARGGNE